MLAEIYNWFTEGFDTADLRDAKARNRVRRTSWLDYARRERLAAYRPT